MAKTNDQCLLGEHDDEVIPSVPVVNNQKGGRVNYESPGVVCLRCGRLELRTDTDRSLGERKEKAKALYIKHLYKNRYNPYYQHIIKGLQ